MTNLIEQTALVFKKRKKRQEEKIQEAEMKLLKWSVELTLKGRLRNKEVRARPAVGNGQEKYGKPDYVG